jgi:hypothetical protein
MKVNIRSMSGKWGHGFFWLLCLMLASSYCCRSQTKADDNPHLHHRTDKDTVIVTNRHASTLLPEDASGEYLLGDSGNVIEISLQSGQLDGYISKLGDLESDRGAPLTYFFTRAELHQRRLSFVTRRVHGVWYSFDGSIVRGPARTRKDAGYYLLEGELVEHNNAGMSQEQGRTVSLKSSRRLGED